MKFFLRAIALCFLLAAGQRSLFAQSDSIEVFVIESFVSAENPGTFQLTFNTSVPCKSKIIIANQYSISLSDTLTDTHKKSIDISKMHFDSLNTTFRAILTDSTGHTNQSDAFEIQLPATEEKAVEVKGGGLSSCFYGGLVYLIPNATLNMLTENNKLKGYWGVSKELPLFSHYQGGYNFPESFISAEYSYVPQFDHKNYVRLGYKKLFETGFGEFIVLGLNGFSNFRGSNGVSPEISWGLLPLKEGFTLYIRYRYSTDFNTPRKEFSEVSLGLYSWFFSAHL